MPVNGDMSALLELVECPQCRGELVDRGGQLACASCGRVFAVENGVPVLEVGDGSGGQPSAVSRLHYALLGRPRVYEFHQAHGGGKRIAARVGAELRGVGGATLVDIGAGTGMVGGLVPPGTRYVWLDNDTLKLRGLLSRGMDCLAVLGDAARLPFRTGAADLTVMVEVSHHLPDAVLQASVDEAARVTRERFVFVDALRGTRARSRLLWQLDLGRFPRTEDELVGALERSFTIERIERFRINHDHVLCVCVPRAEGGGASAA